MNNLNITIKKRSPVTIDMDLKSHSCDYGLIISRYMDTNIHVSIASTFYEEFIICS